MHNKQEVKKVLIARNCDRTVGLTSANVLENIGAGEIVVLNQGGSIITTEAEAKTAKAIKLVQGLTGGGYNITDLLYKSKIDAFIGTKFEQSAEQRIAVGFNGTSGAIEVFDDNSYSITLEYDNTGAQLEEDKGINKISYKSSFSGATQHEVAVNIASLYAATIERISNFGIKVNVISDKAFAGNVTGCELVNGSKAVSYTGGTPLVGNSIAFEGVTGTPYRDELNGIYVITSIDSVNKVMTLSMPYQNVSQVAGAGMLITDVTADDYGIVIEGKMNSFRVGYGDYTKTFVQFQRNGFGITPVTENIPGFNLNIGNGRHESVSIEEFNYQAYTVNDGSSRDWAEYTNETKVGSGYSGITINYNSRRAINTIEDNGSKKTLLIFVERGSYQDIVDNAAGTALGTNIITGTGADAVSGSSFLNVLNAFMVSDGIIATGINTVSNEGKSLASDGTFDAGIDL